MQKVQAALSAIAVLGVLILIGLSVSSQSTLAEALARGQVAEAETESALAKREQALISSFDEAANGMITLAKAMSEPRPLQAESIGDAAESALILSRLTDSQCRQYAAYILGRLGGEKAETRLIEMAKVDPDTSASQAALQALQNMQSQKVGPIVLEKLRTGNPNHQQAAASMLSNIATREMVPEICKILGTLGGRDHNVQQIRYYLYRAFERLGDPRACPAIIEALQQETETYRRSQGIEALMACASIQFTPQIVSLLDTIDLMHNNHSGSWSDFLQAVNRIGDPRYAPLTVKFVTHSSSSYRRMALEALSRMEDPAIAEELLEAWKNANGSTKTEIEKLLDDGYPGIKKAAEGKEYTVVDDETMKKLISERDERIKNLVKQDGKVEPVKVREEDEIF